MDGWVEGRMDSRLPFYALVLWSGVRMWHCTALYYTTLHVHTLQQWKFHTGDPLAQRFYSHSIAWHNPLPRARRSYLAPVPSERDELRLDLPLT